MNLIITEKPDQAAKLAAPFPSRRVKDHIAIRECDQFPSGAVITWAVGHVCELFPPDAYNHAWKKWQLEALPIIPEQFQYRVTRSKRHIYKVIEKFVRQPDITSVIIAGDAGREGEAIIRLILQQCRNKKPLKRLWISSLTPKAVQKGFQNLLEGDETTPLFYEALSRAYADWLIGMNGSRLYTLLLQQYGIRDVYSIGRVQTPTLALIVKRENEIDSFKSETFWEVKAEFEMAGHYYEGTWHKDGETRLKDSETARKIALFCKQKQAAITDVATSEKDVLPPYFFNLSSLQAAANKRFKYPPKKTLDIAQRLYVKGIISYPRTDSVFITKEEAQAFPDILQKLQSFQACEPYFPLPQKELVKYSRYINPGKVTDHHAIIPTEQVVDPDSLSKDEKHIYTMITERLIAAYYPPCKTAHTTINTLVDGRATFQSKGKQVLQKGWRNVIAVKQERETELPVLTEGTEGRVKDAFTKESKTKPPKRYSEGDLITLMKTAGKHIEDDSLIKIMNATEGLGTEATRAGIITVLKDRQYINVSKNTVYPTEKGKLLIEAVGNSILASPEMTAKWEQRLSEIGKGEADMDVFMSQVKKLTRSLMHEGRACSSDWSFQKETLEKAAAFQTSGKGKRRSRRSSPGKCLLCSGQVIDKGTFYGCGNFRKNGCSFTISKHILGQQLVPEEIKNILQNGQSSLIKGFKSNEKSFDASLVWDKEQKKLTFLFKKARSTDH